MDKLYIVIPAYNEAANIENFVKEWYPIVETIGNSSRMAVFNDGSKDNTLAILNELKGKFPFLEVIDKPNSGHGPTCLFAYKYALKNGADYIFQTDSDGQTKAVDFGKFWEKRKDFDILLGFRKQRGDGIARLVISRVLRVILFFIFGEYVLDANTPFRLMKAGSLTKYVPEIPDNFFLTNSLLTVLYKKNKHKMLWMVVQFHERAGGENSINIKQILKLAFKIIKDLRNYNRGIKHAKV
jgi:glycosyltransferase involved in cell wall biosynthesis